MKIRRPWYATMAAKLVLSRLPLGYAAWRRLNLFSHGAMHKPEYAYSVFRRHFERIGSPVNPAGFTALEIGPGDSLLSAVIAKAHGATRTYLIDAGAFATRDVSVYRKMASFLRERGFNTPEMALSASFDDVLHICGAAYETRGLESLRGLPSESVDFMWSQAVLEHVRRDEFLETMRELRRVLRPTGVASHCVDLKDHLGGALNNMRIPSRWWETGLMASSGFYTNRIRFPEMLDLFHQAGFRADVADISRWATSPTPKASLAEEFREFTDGDLLVKEFDVVLRPA